MDADFKGEVCHFSTVFKHNLSASVHMKTV